jgi:TPR repeat protein
MAKFFNTMNVCDCWSTAYDLIVSGKTDKAIELCETEPCAGLPECQNFLGWTFYTERKMDQALVWFRKAADQGDGEALFGIGSVYWTQKEHGSARKYFERAAERGYARAYHWIGSIYLYGLGVPKNLDMAIHYCELSALHGCIVGKRALLRLAWNNGNILTKSLVPFKFFYLFVKTQITAYRDPGDPRIADIRTKFGEK